MNNIDNVEPETNPDLKYKKKQEELYNKILLQQLKEQELANQKDGEKKEDSDPVVLQVETKGILGTHFCKVLSDKELQFDKEEQILIEHDGAIEIAVIVEIGYLALRKFKSQDVPDEEISMFKRKLTEDDLTQYNSNLNEEKKARPIFFDLVKKYELNMKLVDIHYQFDKRKLFFFYTSDGRVDFRELAKSLAGKFKTRIELRQIGVRDEAKILGGLGTCGREFCCSTFLSNFKRITTQIANEQNLSSNMSKLSGPCGKLKCCLSYEVDVVDLEKLAEVHLSGSESDPE